MKRIHTAVSLVAALLVLLIAGEARAEEAPESLLFKLGNNAGVSNNPTEATLFSLDGPAHITGIWTYHWNQGKGAAPGTIGLRDVKTDRMVGVWDVVGFKSLPGGACTTWPDEGNGPPCMYWTVKPEVTVPAGTYEVVDSEVSTWSTNESAGNAGMAFVYGRAATEAPATEATEELLKAALEAYYADEFEKAIGLADQAIAIDPDDASAYDIRGKAHAGLGWKARILADPREEYGRAIADFDQALKCDPERTDAWYDRATTNSMVGDAERYDGLDASASYTKAIHDFGEALSRKPDDRFSYSGRADAYARLGEAERAKGQDARGKFECAIADYGESLKRDTSDVWTYRSRADALVDLGDSEVELGLDPRGRYEAAIADYSKAVDLDAEYASTYNDRGEAFGKLGASTEWHEGGRAARPSYARAIEDFDEALKRNPRYPELYRTNRAEAYIYLGDADQAEGIEAAGNYESAISDCREVLRETPEHARAYSLLGRALHSSGQVEEAVKVLTEAVRLFPDNEAFKTALAKVTEEPPADGKPPETPDKSEELRKAARDACDAEEYERAVALADEALRLNPQDALASQVRGEAHFELGNKVGFSDDPSDEYVKAIADLGEFLRRSPKDGLARFRRARAYAGLAKAEWKKGQDPRGNLERAIAEYGEVLELDSWDPDTYGSRAMTYQTLGDVEDALGMDPTGRYESAIADCAEALRLLPDDGATVGQRGDAYLRLALSLSARGKEAWEAFSRAIADHGQALEIAAREGDLDDARWRRTNRAEAYTELGKARKLAGLDPGDSFEKAIADCRAVLEQTPRHRIAFERLARALIACDQLEAAGRVLATAVEAYPDDEDLKKLLSSVTASLAAGTPPHEKRPSRMQPADPGSPTFEIPTPGETLVAARIGPGGGRLEAAGEITVDLPPGAVVRDQVISLKRGGGGLDGVTTWFIEGEQGGHLQLNEPATVRIPVPAGTNPDELVVFQEIDESAAIGLKPDFDAASGSLVFSVDHFSWLSWGKVQKWGIAGTAWTALLLVGSGGGFAGLTLFTYIGAGFAMGTIEAPKLEHIRQTRGLDSRLVSPHFSLHYAQEGEYGLECNNPLVLVRMKGNAQWTHVAGATIEKAREKYPDAEGILTVNPDVNYLAHELEVVYEYYRQAGYEPPDHTWASVFPGVGRSDPSDPGVAGQWDPGPPGHPGFLQVNSSVIRAEDRRERHQTISHEYFHAICEAHGWDGVAPCTEESLTTTLERVVFPNCGNPTENREWVESIRFLENGLMARSGPNEGGADSVKRGYWLWPFGAFLLHRLGGHEDLKRYMSGDLQDDAMSSSYRAFARALFDKEGAPEAEEEAGPLVSMNGEQAPFKVSTGWGGYSPDSPDICRETLTLGTATPGSTLATLRPLSFTMRRIEWQLPRKCGAKEAPVLVVRRSVPWPSEEYLFKGERSETVSSREVLSIGGGDLLAADGGALRGRLGIVDASSDNVVDDPLVAYLLASPSLVQVPPSPASPQVYPVYRVDPCKIEGAHGGINPSEVTAGFRVILRQKPKEGVARGNLVFADDLLPLDTKTFDVRDVAGRTPPESVEVAGICAEDRELKDEGGHTLRSGPFMLKRGPWDGIWKLKAKWEEGDGLLELVSDGKGGVTNQGDAYPWPPGPEVEVHTHVYRVQGAVNGQECTGTWTRHYDYTHRSTNEKGEEERLKYVEEWRGTFRLTMSADGQSFTGLWSYSSWTANGENLGAGGPYEITGTRIK